MASAQEVDLDQLGVRDESLVICMDQDRLGFLPFENLNNRHSDQSPLIGKRCRAIKPPNHNGIRPTPQDLTEPSPMTLSGLTSERVCQKSH
jgi:hypothetical protein